MRYNLIMLRPTHETRPCPINRVFIFSQQSMIERKETSLTLFLLTVHHFVCKIALAGLCICKTLRHGLPIL